MSSIILYISQLEEQGFGIQWDNIFVSPVKKEMFNVGFASVFLIFDSVLYGMIGVIVILIKDLKTKEKESLNKIFSKIANCWLISVDIGKEESSSNRNENTLDIEKDKITAQEKASTQNKVGVQLENLTKAYNISRTEERLAVSDLSLSFNVGEVRPLYYYSSHLLQILIIS
jgi:hypothetical protein